METASDPTLPDIALPDTTLLDTDTTLADTDAAQLPEETSIGTVVSGNSHGGIHFKAEVLVIKLSQSQTNISLHKN